MTDDPKRLFGPKRVRLAHLTCRCGSMEKWYSPRWDALFCGTCHAWLESTCPDPECTHCKGRPLTSDELVPL